jgi:hypothetical protein
VLALLGRPRVVSAFLWRPRFRSWTVVVLYTLIARMATLGRCSRSLVEWSIQWSIHGPVGLAVSGRRTDFEFVQLIPLFVGTIPFGDGVEFSNPATRINWLRIIHGDIMNHSRDFIQPSHVINGQNRL